jgi:TetR/AcrR family transcriptional repressor of bet genes
MGRPSVRAKRRAEIAQAFARVLGARGEGGATIAAVAAEAGIAPGLVHHYFVSKQDLHEALLEELVAAFRRREAGHSDRDPLDAYVSAALALGERSDVVAARAWVGVLAEALADPVLFAKVRRVLDTEIAHVERRADGTLPTEGASAVVAFVIGALVFGAFAPRKTAGFAAPSLRRMPTGLRTRSRVA